MPKKQMNLHEIMETSLAAIPKVIETDDVVKCKALVKLINRNPLSRNLTHPLSFCVSGHWQSVVLYAAECKAKNILLEIADIIAEKNICITQFKPQELAAAANAGVVLFPQIYLNSTPSPLVLSGNPNNNAPENRKRANENDSHDDNTDISFKKPKKPNK